MRSRLSALAMGGALFAFALPCCLAPFSPALAAECSVDIGNLAKKRQSIIDQLNKLAKSSPRGQLDPAVSCPKLRELAGAETALLAYLQKNKDWCMVPDEAISNLAMSLNRSRMVAGRACTIAEQMKKNEEAGAQKLPSGPL
ncbi:MAG: hypothetical protein ACREC1_05855 [Methylovirgula sp.]